MLKLNHNKKYTTIAIYTVIVFFLCLVVYKFTFTWNDSLTLLRSGLKLLAPFSFALIIAYFISPMVNFIENYFLTKLHIGDHYLRSHKVIRILSIFISYVTILGAIIILSSIVLPQLAESLEDIRDRLPGLFEKFLYWVNTSEFKFGEDLYRIDLGLLNTYILDKIPKSFEQFYDFLEAFAPDLLATTFDIASGFLNLLLGFVIAIYLIYNKESYLSSARKLITALLPIDRSPRVFKNLRESHRIFSKFIIGKLLDSFIIGVLCFIILLIARIPYPLLISVVVGITNMIPYFGPFIGGGIGIVFLLIGTPYKALIFGIIIIILQQFDGNILGPKILGDSTGLTPFWVIFAIILFGGIFGIPGMFIGVPCFAVLKNIFDNYIDQMYREKMALRRAEDDPDAHYHL